VFDQPLMAHVCVGRMWVPNTGCLGGADEFEGRAPALRPVGCLTGCVSLVGPVGLPARMIRGLDGAGPLVDEVGRAEHTFEISL
jgi:hypothetical protein